eukprot:763096-Hanusia_phi.AAC.2
MKRKGRGRHMARQEKGVGGTNWPRRDCHQVIKTSSGARGGARARARSNRAGPTDLPTSMDASGAGSRNERRGGERSKEEGEVAGGNMEGDQKRMLAAM